MKTGDILVSNKKSIIYGDALEIVAMAGRVVATKVFSSRRTSGIYPLQWFDRAEIEQVIQDGGLVAMSKNQYQSQHKERLDI